MADQSLIDSLWQQAALLAAERRIFFEDSARLALALLLDEGALVEPGSGELVSAALVEALAEVRRLHSKRTFDGDGYGWAVCAECRQSWPCATEQAIDAQFRSVGMTPLDESRI